MKSHHLPRTAKVLAAAAAATLLTPTSAHADLLVYEPFDYAEGTVLEGQGGALGTTGTWHAFDSVNSNNWWVHAEGTASGIVVAPGPPVVRNEFDGVVANLPTSGGYVGLPNPTFIGADPDLDFEIGRNMVADIALDPSVTATFTSGTTTWISYVSIKGWDRNEEHPNLVLGTDPAPDGSRGDNFGGIGTGGTGIGTGGGPNRNNRTTIYPMFYTDGQYNNVQGPIPGNSYASNADTIVDSTGSFVWQENDTNGDFGAPNIVIMKIEWDADTGGEDIVTVVRFLEEETLDEAAFDAHVVAKPNLSSGNWSTTNKPDLDQSQFDTLAFVGLKVLVDEIRLGTTFEDAIKEVAGPSETFELTIDQVGADLVFEWDSTLGKVYNLRSTDNLELDFSLWDLEEGNIPNTAPTNMKTIVKPGDPVRFYRAEEVTSPAVTIFSEDFDTTTAGLLPGGWSTSANAGFEASLTNWELGTPSVVGPVPPGTPLPSGTQCVGTDLDADYDDPPTEDGTPSTDIWLRSAPIDLTGQTEATLTFQQWTEIEVVAGDLDYGSIRILDAFDDSELAVLEDQTIDGTTTGWEEYSAALPAAAFTATNGTIRVEFRFEADDIASFPGWYIDALQVTIPGP